MDKIQLKKCFNKRIYDFTSHWLCSQDPRVYTLYTVRIKHVSFACILKLSNYWCCLHSNFASYDCQKIKHLTIKNLCRQNLCLSLSYIHNTDSVIQ